MINFQSTLSVLKERKRTFFNKSSLNWDFHILQLHLSNNASLVRNERFCLGQSYEAIAFFKDPIHYIGVQVTLNLHYQLGLRLPTLLVGYYMLEKTSMLTILSTV